MALLAALGLRAADKLSIAREIRRRIGRFEALRSAARRSARSNDGLFGFCGYGCQVIVQALLKLNPEPEHPFSGSRYQN
jgi:hypothetical protein